MSEINNFMSRKAFITIKTIQLKSKDRKTIPLMWACNSKEETDGSICLNSRNVVT